MFLVNMLVECEVILYERFFLYVKVEEKLLKVIFEFDYFY